MKFHSLTTLPKKKDYNRTHKLEGRTGVGGGGEGVFMARYTNGKKLRMTDLGYA